MAKKPQHTTPAGFLCGRPDVVRPWQVTSADIVGSLPRSSAGYSHILNVSDYFSKFCVFQPMRAASAATVVRLLEDNVLLLFGVPQKIIADIDS